VDQGSTERLREQLELQRCTQLARFDRLEVRHTPAGLQQLGLQHARITHLLRLADGEHDRKERAMMRRIIRRTVPRWVTLLAAALLLTPMTVLAATPAQAADCSSNAHYYYQPGVEVGVSFNWAPECSDGIAQLWGGTVYDRLCDGRAGYAWFKVYDRQPNGTYLLLATSPKYAVTNGSGSSASFPTWRPRSPGSIGWKLAVVLQACNSGSCSTARTYNSLG
jgi:hypothetical protein